MKNENPMITGSLLAPVRSKALRIGVGIALLSAGVATSALLLFLMMHAANRFTIFLITFAATLAAIALFCGVVAFRLLLDRPNRTGHLLPAWFYYGFGCTLTALFLACLWGMYKKGIALPDMVTGVLSFSFLITLCLLAHRAAKKPAPGDQEV